MSTIDKEIKNITSTPLVYPTADDIYNMSKEVDIDPEYLVERRSTFEQPGKLNEKNFSEDQVGTDLDVPGAELDDEQEKIGSEDEENNYYSIGGDDHNILDENNGD